MKRNPATVIMIPKVWKATGVNRNGLLQDQSDYFNKICCIKDFSFKDFFQICLGFCGKDGVFYRLIKWFQVNRRDVLEICWTIQSRRLIDCKWRTISKRFSSKDVKIQTVKWNKKKKKKNENIQFSSIVTIFNWSYFFCLLSHSLAHNF